MSRDTTVELSGSTDLLNEYKDAIVVSSDEEWDEILDRKGKGVLGHGKQRHIPNNVNEQRESCKVANEKRSRSTEEKDKKRKLTDKQIAIIAEYDDFDLDAVVENLLQPSKRRAMEILKATKKPSAPLNVKCPICTRLYPRDKVERHASDCTGEYSDTEDDPNSRKNTIASSVAKHQAKHQAKQRSDPSFVENVNYYAESEDLLASDGTGLNGEITGLTWESRGQTRFS